MSTYHKHSLKTIGVTNQKLFDIESRNFKPFVTALITIGKLTILEDFVQPIPHFQYLTD